MVHKKIKKIKKKKGKLSRTLDKERKFELSGNIIKFILLSNGSNGNGKKKTKIKKARKRVDMINKKLKKLKLKNKRLGGIISKLSKSRNVQRAIIKINRSKRNLA